MRFFLCVLLVLLVLPMQQACLSSSASKLALFDPAQLAWPNVRDDIEVGIVDGLADGDIGGVDAVVIRDRSSRFQGALRSKDRDALRLIHWSTLKPWAERGINAQLESETIGPGVAESFREHLRNFDEIIEKLRQPEQRGIFQ